MQEDELTKILPPVWNWKDSGWWLDAMGFSTAFFGALIAAQSFIGGALITIGLGLAVALMLRIFLYSVKYAKYAFLRFREYEKLYEKAERLNAIHQISQLLLKVLHPNLKQVEITTVQRYRDEIFIRVSKGRHSKVEIGARIWVFDKQANSVIGLFEVSSNEKSELVAKAVQIEPVWAGYIHQVTSPEMKPPPDTMAILVPEIRV